MQTSLARAISRPLASATVLVIAEVDCSKSSSHILCGIVLILCRLGAGFSEVDASAEGSADETIVAESEGTTEIIGNNRMSGVDT